MASLRRRVLFLVLAPLAAAAAGCRRAAPPGEELRVGLATTLSTLDPHRENTIANLEQLGSLYEPLVTLDAEVRVSPCLATSWTNPDPVTWVFQLRPSVRFHDGTPLTSEDVVFTVTRLLGDQSLRVRAYLPSVAEASPAGSDRVVIRTRWPDAQLLAGLAYVPVVRKGSTSEGLARSANGTGPWSLEGWEPPRRLRLRRNPFYWGARPDVERVVVDLGLSERRTRASLAVGHHDVLRFGVTAVEEAARWEKAYAVLAHPNIFLRHLGFDVERDETPYCPGIPNPFRKAAVREAVALALDRPAIARRVGPSTIVATQLVPQAIFGYDPAVPAPVHDLERARRLLAEAGYPRGFDVVLHRSGFEAAADEVREQLARAGIRVTVERLPSPDFFARLGRHELSFWISASGCPSGDALELLWVSFHSPDPSRGAGLDNHGGYRDAELDRIAEEAARSLEPSVRLPLLRRGLARVLADGVWVPLYYAQDVLIVRRAFTVSPRADGFLRYADVRRAGPA